MLVAFEGFHDHQDSFQLPIKSAILTVEPIHTTRHVTDKSDQLWLLLWTSQLHTSKIINTHKFLQVTLTTLRSMWFWCTFWYIFWIQILQIQKIKNLKIVGFF